MAAICGRDIDDTFQLRPGIPDLGPDLLVTDRDHPALTQRTVLLLLGQGIHLHTADWEISKHLVITRFGLTFLLTGIRFNEFLLGYSLRKQVHLPGKIIPFLAGTAKKFLLEILELCLQICNDPVLFVIPGIAFFQHPLQRPDQVVLGTDGRIQL